MTLSEVQLFPIVCPQWLCPAWSMTSQALLLPLLPPASHAAALGVFSCKVLACQDTQQPPLSAPGQQYSEDDGALAGNRKWELRV